MRVSIGQRRAVVATRHKWHNIGRVLTKSNCRRQRNSYAFIILVELFLCSHQKRLSFDTNWFYSISVEHYNLIKVSYACLSKDNYFFYFFKYILLVCIRLISYCIIKRSIFTYLNYLFFFLISLVVFSLYLAACN